MKKDRWILGISGVGDEFHDNSVCLIKNGNIIFAASEERYSRVKHDAKFPSKALEAGLRYAGIRRSDIDLYTSGWPLFSALRNLKTIIAKEVLFSALRYVRNSNLKGVTPLIKMLGRLKMKSMKPYLPPGKHKIIDHYLAHAASAYRTANLTNCLAVVWDGFGIKQNGALASGGVFVCQEGQITEVEAIPLEASIGLFYEAVTNTLGFVPAEGEGKTMGLAAYGNSKRFIDHMRSFAPHFERGQWRKSRHWPDTLASVDLKYKQIFTATYLGQQLAKMIRLSREDAAAACQQIIEEEAVNYLRYLYSKYKLGKFVTAGGVFLNVKMGKKIRELPFVEDFYVHPHASDGGLALGAALEIYAREYAAKPVVFQLESVALGEEFAEDVIKRELVQTSGFSYEKPSHLTRYVAERIVAGVVVGWFQGRAEWGPRALGQRSVLADPRKPEIKERINSKLKKRDWFMPFAPAILEERMHELLVDAIASPFMTMAFDVTPKGKKALAAAMHVDNTCRPQTVSRRQNPLYWEVITEFEKLTGVPAVLNTSFNRHGLPIVNSPTDALQHLEWGAVDELVIGPFVIKRK